MKRIPVLLAVVAAALLCLAPGRCGGDEGDDTIEPTAEMETAMATTADVLTASLLAVELTNAASDENAQATFKAGTCPVVTREVGTVTLDYGAGCVPDSGLVPEPISGAVSLSVNRVAKSIDATFVDLGYGDYGLDGGVSASYARDGLGVELMEQMDMTFTTATQTLDVVQDVTLTVRATWVGVDGTVDYDDGVDQYLLDAVGVQWDYEDLLLACPLPKAGTITVGWDVHEVTLTFDAQSPSTGVAHVASGPIAGDVDVCAYWFGAL